MTWSEVITGRLQQRLKTSLFCVHLSFGIINVRCALWLNSSIQWFDWSIILLPRLCPLQEGTHISRLRHCSQGQVRTDQINHETTSSLKPRSSCCCCLYPVLCNIYIIYIRQALFFTFLKVGIGCYESRLNFSSMHKNPQDIKEHKVGISELCIWV
jgi:hypothetical protein